MTDIVERLLEFAGPRYPDDICGKLAMGDAAAEIVRLRAERAELRKLLVGLGAGIPAAAILRAEDR